MQSNTSPEPLPRKRFFLRRVFVSTWFVMLLVCCALFLLEVPGRRTGLTTYEHGWPLAFLKRDCRPEATTLDDGSRIPDLTSVSDSQYLELVTPHWERIGLPWDLESRFSPWSLADAKSFNSLNCLADLIFAGLVLLTVGWAWQRRRRIRGGRLQFRLRTLLAGVALPSVIFAQIKSWIVDRRADEETAAALLHDIGHIKYQYASDPFGGIPPRDRGIVLEFGWDPPYWLPESLLKIGGLPDLFRRVHGVRLDDDPKAGDAVLERLAKLRQVQSLEIWNVGVAEPGLAALSQFDRLTELRIVGGPVSATGVASIAGLPRLQRLDVYGVKAEDFTLERLASLRSLTELSLRGEKVQPDGAIIDDWPQSPVDRPKAGEPSIHAAGIRQLQRLPHLRSLTLEHQRLTDAAVEALSEMSGLESLALDPVLMGKVSLHGLRRLKELRLDSRPNPISVELHDLPALEQLVVIGAEESVKPQPLTLRGVANLSFFDTSRMALDNQSWQEIHGSQRLVLLHTDRFEEDKSGTWKLRGFPMVREVETCYSPISEMPELEQVRFSYSPTAKQLRFDGLPSLSQVVLEGNAQLSEVDFVGTPNVRTIGLQFIDARSENASGPQQISIPGLVSLTKLERFDADTFPLSAASLHNLGQLTNLSSITLRAKEFDDRGLASLKGLVNLKELNLSGTAITDSGLSVIGLMNKLETLDLVGTQVSAKGVAVLQQQLPKLKIEWYPTK